MSTEAPALLTEIERMWLVFKARGVDSVGLVAVFWFTKWNKY